MTQDGCGQCSWGGCARRKFLRERKMKWTSLVQFRRARGARKGHRGGRRERGGAETQRRELWLADCSLGVTRTSRRYRFGVEEQWTGGLLARLMAARRRGATCRRS